MLTWDTCLLERLSRWAAGLVALAPTPKPLPCGRGALYGFGIPLNEVYAGEVNRAIRRPGSFYSYGRGGSVTIVDPVRGMVFFAYAG